MALISFRELDRGFASTKAYAVLLKGKETKYNAVHTVGLWTLLWPGYRREFKRKRELAVFLKERLLADIQEAKEALKVNKDKAKKVKKAKIIKKVKRK